LFWKLAITGDRERDVLLLLGLLLADLAWEGCKRVKSIALNKTIMTNSVIMSLGYLQKKLGIEISIAICKRYQKQIPLL